MDVERLAADYVIISELGRSPHRGAASRESQGVRQL